MTNITLPDINNDINNSKIIRVEGNVITILISGRSRTHTNIIKATSIELSDDDILNLINALLTN